MTKTTKKTTKKEQVQETANIDFDIEEVEENVEVEVSTKTSPKVAPKTSMKVGAKKGRKTWERARLLTVEGKKDGYRYRWCSKDADNLKRKEQEGWIKVTSTSGLTGDHQRPEDIQDGSVLTTGANEYRELVLYALPEEIGKLRDEYHEELTKANAGKPGQELKENMANLGPANAKLHGGINVKFD